MLTIVTVLANRRKKRRFLQIDPGRFLKTLSIGVKS